MWVLIAVLVATTEVDFRIKPRNYYMVDAL